MWNSIKHLITVKPSSALQSTRDTIRGNSSSFRIRLLMNQSNRGKTEGQLLMLTKQQRQSDTNHSKSNKGSSQVLEDSSSSSSRDTNSRRHQSGTRRHQKCPFSKPNDLVSIHRTCRPRPTSSSDSLRSANITTSDSNNQLNSKLANGHHAIRRRI